MKSIKILDPLIANQIAAGEVIERPSSIIKELLENSLDAGAKAIKIDIERGGSQLIRIQDDGHGIKKDELPLAVQRFGTSKIAHLNDLEAISSLGFRGEALASITAVAKVKISSLATGETTAWQLSAAGTQNQVEEQPVAHPQGTSIEVRELFFNTPARRKFLRTEKTEFTHIETVVKRLSLVNFDVRFELTHNGRTVLKLLPAIDKVGQEKRIQQLTAKDFINHAFHIVKEATGLTLSGWFAASSFSRSQQDLQYMYINGRMVKDKLINHAIRQAYQDKLEYNRFPAYILYLECDPHSVDVNVHPTKHEVRFREGRLIHDFIYMSLRNALQSDDGEVNLDHNESQYSFQASDAPFASSKINEQLKTYGELASDNLAEPGIDNPAAEYATHNQLLKVIAPLHKHYILIETQNGLGFIDIKKTYGMIFLKALTKQMPASQPLLFPLKLPLSNQHLENYEKNKQILKELGFDLSLLGDTQLLLRKAPKVLSDVDFPQFFQELLNNKEINKEQIAHSAVKNHQPLLTQAVLESIVKQVFSLPTVEQGKYFRILDFTAIEKIFS